MNWWVIYSIMRGGLARFFWIGGCRKFWKYWTVWRWIVNILSFCAATFKGCRGWVWYRHFAQRVFWLSAAEQRNRVYRGELAGDVQPRPFAKLRRSFWLQPKALSAASLLPLLIYGALPQRRQTGKNSCEHDFYPFVFSGWTGRDKIR